MRHFWGIFPNICNIFKVKGSKDANVKRDFQFVVECLEGKSDLFSLSMNKQLAVVVYLQWNSFISILPSQFSLLYSLVLVCVCWYTIWHRKRNATTVLEFHISINWGSCYSNSAVTTKVFHFCHKNVCNFKIFSR